MIPSAAGPIVGNYGARNRADQLLSLSYLGFARVTRVCFVIEIREPKQVSSVVGAVRLLLLSRVASVDSHENVERIDR